MRYAIFSDIHGNREALEAVLFEIRRRSVDGYICLGDIVGYGADPNVCLEMIRELKPEVVLGNHDAASCGRTNIDYFNQSARAAILWTQSRLTPGESDYLQSLPLIRTAAGLCLVHSSLDSPAEWKYLDAIEDSRPSFDLLSERVCFIGHTHVSLVFREKNGEITRTRSSFLRLEEKENYIVNVGSVGQPRDLDPRASFGLFDTEAKTVEIIRVEYPVRSAQEKILAAGLPDVLAYRLSLGQ